MADPIPKETILLKQFQDDYFKTLHDFRNKKMFCDVLLEVDGKSYPCHRLVLIAASKYFKTLLSGDFQESTANKVVIEEIEADIMDQILNAIYLAQMELSMANVYLMLKASHFLQLDGIFFECVAYIVKNRCIHYLIHTCLFAGIFKQTDLYDACVEAISNSLIILAQTDIFQEIPFEILNAILSKGNFAKQRDEVLLSIIKWIKSNTCTAVEIHKLLESAKLQNSSVLAVLLSNLKAENTLTNDMLIHTSGNPEYVKQTDSNISFNLYVSTVNVKTGAIGWSSITLDKSFKFDGDRIKSDFHPINSFFIKMCKVESKIYCFESNIYSKQCYFSSYENGKKTELITPKNFIFGCEFELVAIDNAILLIMNCSNTDIWAYDHEKMNWKTKFNLSSSYSYEPNLPALRDISDWCAVTSSNTTLYVIGGKSITHSIFKKIVTFDSRVPSTRKLENFPYLLEDKYLTACTFDDKIAISGSNYDGAMSSTFYILDADQQEIPNIKPMKYGRVNHKLIYANGFIYAVGSSSFVVNEKYDVQSNTWTELPSLPKQLIVNNSEDEVLSIIRVLYAEANPTS